jgi:hypothetical protein
MLSICSSLPTSAGGRLPAPGEYGLSTGSTGDSFHVTLYRSSYRQTGLLLAGSIYS